MVFLEYLVELEGTGEVKGFDTWGEARAWLLQRVWTDFHPFAVSCVKYGPKGEMKTLWEVEWTDPSMRALPEDRRMFREMKAHCLNSLFRLC